MPDKGQLTSMLVHNSWERALYSFIKTRSAMVKSWAYRESGCGRRGKKGSGVVWEGQARSGRSRWFGAGVTQAVLQSSGGGESRGA